MPNTLIVAQYNSWASMDPEGIYGGYRGHSYALTVEQFGTGWSVLFDTLPIADLAVAAVIRHTGPLSAVKRTLFKCAAMSACDPYRTSSTRSSLPVLLAA
jgi:hypothetical protein